MSLEEKIDEWDEAEDQKYLAPCECGAFKEIYVSSCTDPECCGLEHSVQCTRPRCGSYVYDFNLERLLEETVKPELLKEALEAI